MFDKEYVNPHTDSKEGIPYRIRLFQLLSQLAQGHYTTLCYRKLFASHELSYTVRCTSSGMRFCSCIKSSQNTGHAHYTDATKCGLKIILHCNPLTHYERVTTFCVLARATHDFLRS